MLASGLLAIEQIKRRASSKKISHAMDAFASVGTASSRFRARSAITQTALAKDAGVRQATISKVEKGLGTTELQTIYSVCAALGLEIVLRPRRMKSGDISPGELF